MRRRDLLTSAAGLFALGALGRAGVAESAESAATAPAGRLRGVTLAGGEFGCNGPDFSNESPGALGVDYTYNSERTVAWLARQGFSLFRIPFRWERVQPRLGEPLEPRELERLRGVVAWVARHGGRAVLDVHNFGRYVLARDDERCDAVIDGPATVAGEVTRVHFADLWRRLSVAFGGERAVWGYGLMNEPHDLGASDWKQISQAAVDAIRGTGDRTLVLVPGADWSGAGRFADANGTWAWINDPIDHVAYELHCYFDADASGAYSLAYDEERRRDPGLDERGVRRLLHFAGWCAVNRARGFVGEFGVPHDDPRWLAPLRSFVAALDKADLTACAWAAGEWWRPPDDRLSLQPRDDFSRPAPQMSAVLGKE